MPLQRTRNYMSALVAISMLASPAASAAPAPNQIDPLVALSLSGSAESRAAVCGPECSEASMAAVSAGSAGAAAMAAAQDPYDATASRGSMMPLWVALAVVLAGWAWIILDDDEDNDEVDLPESPA